MGRASLLAQPGTESAEIRGTETAEMKRAEEKRIVSARPSLRPVSASYLSNLCGKVSKTVPFIQVGTESAELRGTESAEIKRAEESGFSSPRRT